MPKHLHVEGLTDPSSGSAQLHKTVVNTLKPTCFSNYCAHIHLHNSYIDESTTVVHTGDNKTF